jgi:hypothetical protein
MDAMSIDMDPSAAPANTATSLGTLESCARINENNVLDADEEGAADTLSTDVTATNIPVGSEMVPSSILEYSDPTHRSKRGPFFA